MIVVGFPCRRCEWWVQTTAWIVCLLIFWGCGSNPSGLNLRNLAGDPVDPLSKENRVGVFLFLRTDCPISNRYAPEVRRLHDIFSPRGVDFWLVYIDPNETEEAIAKHAREYGFPGRILRDFEHDLVRLTGARVTPEAAVFTPGRYLAYLGRIDDRYVDFGKARVAASRRDLELALEAVLQGRSILESKTRAVGCFIGDLEVGS